MTTKSFRSPARWGFAIALALPLASCATTDDSSEPFVISGDMTYRERIALPPGAYYRASLQDISRADAPAQEIASDEEQVAEGKQVPLDFEINADPGAFQSGRRYGVRAMIYNVNDELLWTSDTTTPYDPASGSTNVGTIMLVRTGNRAGATSLSGTWEVHSINGTPVSAPNKPTITWDEGKVSGSSGCNQFSGSFQQQGNSLELSEIAMTQRACIAPYDAIEQQFTSALNNLTGFSLVSDGTVAFVGTNGQTMMAHKSN